MRLLDKLARPLGVDAGKADVQARLQEVGAIRLAEIDFGIDGGLCRKTDLALAGGKADRADEAGRPAGGEELLRIGARTAAARR